MISGVIYYIVFSFCRPAISATHLVVFYLALVHIIVTSIKENILTKLQKFYSLPRNLREGNKSPVLFLKKKLFQQAIYCLCTKYSLKSLFICFRYVLNCWRNTPKIKIFYFLQVVFSFKVSSDSM